MKQKLTTLEDLERRYKLGPSLYQKLRQAIILHTEHDKSDILEYTSNLPFQLRQELSVAIYQDSLNKIPLFAFKTNEFISFVGPLLTPGKLP